MKVKFLYEFALNYLTFIQGGADDTHDTATIKDREASVRTAARGLVARHSVSRSQFTGGA
jgi:hypothetical protein